MLLILIGGGLFYVFNIQDADVVQGRAPITAAESDQADNVEPTPRFSLQKTTITRDGNHFLAEINIHCRNENERALELIPPGTRLLAAGDHEVPAFFLPFQVPVKVPAAGEMDITLRYWLSHDEINGPVSLNIDNEIVPVKTGGFADDVLSDKQSRSFTGTDWNKKA